MVSTIYIPNEIKSRELDGRLLLTTFLLDNGYDVMIGSRSGIKRELAVANNGVYIPKSVTVNEIDFYKDIKSRGNKIFLLHAEGVALFRDIKEELISMYPKKCSKYIDRFFVCGVEIKKMMIKYLKYIDSDKIHVVGDPRFDLLKPKYLPFWKKELKSFNNQFGNYILINTNFGTGNPRIGLEEVINFYKTNKDYSENIRKKYLYKVKFINEIMSIYIKSIKTIAKRFKELNFIVRPHPSESLDIYQNEFKYFDNIHVLNKGNITKWILASKAVIHYDCTTGLEAVIADKTCISFLPKYDDEILAWLPVLVSKKTSKVKEIIDILSSNMINSIYNKKKDALKTFSDYLINYGNESSEKIIKIINNTKMNTNKKQTSFNRIFELYKRRTKSRIILFLFDLGLYKQKNGDSLFKFGSISNREIIFKLQKLFKINNIKSNFKIFNLGSDVTLLKKKL